MYLKSCNNLSKNISLILCLGFVSAGAFGSGDSFDALADDLLSSASKTKSSSNYGAFATSPAKDVGGSTGEEATASADRRKAPPLETHIYKAGEAKYNEMSATHSISFSGAAFYYPYELGVAAYLQKHFDLSDVCFLGASAGAFTSTLLACKADIENDVMGVKVSHNKKTDEWKYTVTNPDSWIVQVNNNFKKTGVYGYVIDAMQKANDTKKILKDDAYLDASKRATFSLTDVSLWWSGLSLTKMSSWWPTNERISSFGSKEAVVNYGFASAHIPWIVDGSFFASVIDVDGNTKKYIDGGVTDNQPVFNDKTIKVSPYMWSWIWGGYSPLGLLHFYGNTSMERNYKLYFDGYRHAAEHPEHWKGLPSKRSHGSHNSTH